MMVVRMPVGQVARVETPFPLAHALLHIRLVFDRARLQPPDLVPWPDAQPMVEVCNVAADRLTEDSNETCAWSLRLPHQAM
eukprot:6189433-Pleurochrysis_carterae.AAC.1